MKRSWKFFIAVLVLGLTVLAAGGVFAEGDTTATPYLGVRLIPNSVGAQVIFVEPQSPAEQVGIQYLDVITHINGQAVKASTFADVLHTAKVGDEVNISVKRGEEDLVFHVTLADLADYYPPMQMEAVAYNGETQEWLIEELSSNELLAQAGLQTGDILQKFDDTAYSPTALAEYLNGKDSTDTVQVALKRGEEIKIVDVSVEALQTLPFVNANGFNHFEFPFHVFFAHNSGYLGVVSIPMTEQIAEENTMNYHEGALIERVLSESPAATAGLQVNDIVTAINGEVVDNEYTLQDRLSAYEVGDTIEMTVLRNGEEMTLTATLAPYGSTSSLNAPLGSSDMGGNQ